MRILCLEKKKVDPRIPGIHPNTSRLYRAAYIMPPMPPMPPAGGAAGSLEGRSVIEHSVVRINAAIEAAFCSALLVTFAGSVIPASNMFTQTIFAASNPMSAFSCFAFSAMIDPSSPAFSAIWRIGSSSALRTIL